MTTSDATDTCDRCGLEQPAWRYAYVHIATGMNDRTIHLCRQRCYPELIEWLDHPAAQVTPL